jgi:hypothetical protein
MTVWAHARAEQRDNGAGIAQFWAHNLGMRCADPLSCEGLTAAGPISCA